VRSERNSTVIQSGFNGMGLTATPLWPAIPPVSPPASRPRSPKSGRKSDIRGGARAPNSRLPLAPAPKLCRRVVREFSLAGPGSFVGPSHGSGRTPQGGRSCTTKYRSYASRPWLAPAAGAARRRADLQRQVARNARVDPRSAEHGPGGVSFVPHLRASLTAPTNPPGNAERARPAAATRNRSFARIRRRASGAVLGTASGITHINDRAAAPARDNANGDTMASRTLVW
jgi:hypothetical protein